jgi:hypothetical protein
LEKITRRFTMRERRQHPTLKEKGRLSRNRNRIKGSLPQTQVKVPDAFLLRRRFGWGALQSLLHGIHFNPKSAPVTFAQRV